MKQIIKFTDIDVDGCNTDIAELIQVEGPVELTNGIIQDVTNVIETYKEENYGEWDTDGVVNAACEYLQSIGYECTPLFPDYEIEF